MTRPVDRNGFGLTTSQAASEIEILERTLLLLPDVPAIYPEWKRLVTKHSVSGVQVHDTRLVASMNIHNVRQILTFNVGDFKRYGIEVLHPEDVR